MSQLFSLFSPHIDQLYQQFAEENHVPGYAFGIMFDGSLIHASSGGYLDLSQRIPATPSSLFRIASITKSFTAMAILMLRDAGKLRLDDPIDLYLPSVNFLSLTHDAPAITISNLLTHSAGLPQDDPWADRKLDLSEKKVIQLLEQGINFSTLSGSSYEYSNLGYVLLGLIISQVTGMSYQQFIASHIWQPLAMEQAAWDYTAVPTQHLAHGYRWLNQQWQEEALLADGSFAAMGGMYASVEAFSRYVALHQAAWPPRDAVDNGPLKRSSLREMHQLGCLNEAVHTPQIIADNLKIIINGYGYGLRHLRDEAGKLYIGHSGGLPGFGSNWWFLPDYNIAAILFTNVTYAPANLINLQILNKLIKEANLLPRRLTPSSILQERQIALLELLPNWDHAVNFPIFASNFFLDFPITMLQQESKTQFANAGKILDIGPLIPENQLRGYFIIKAQKNNLRISFTLTPENPPLIQSYKIETLNNTPP